LTVRQKDSIKWSDSNSELRRPRGASLHLNQEDSTYAYIIRDLKLNAGEVLDRGRSGYGYTGATF
jgi:hypothetical protein